MQAVKFSPYTYTFLIFRLTKFSERHIINAECEITVEIKIQSNSEDT